MQTMRWTALALACLLASAGAAVTIAVTSEPPLPVANLFVNPGLEEGDDKPDGWAVSASDPGVVDFSYPKTGGYRGAYLRMDAHGSTSNGYLSQPVRLVGDTLYRAGIRVRLRGGRMVLWLHAWVNERRFDERVYHTSWGALPLIPDFVNLDWTTSPDPEAWTWVGREFRTWPEQTSVNPHFGVFFERGSMDLDEAFIGLARTTLKLTAGGAPLARVVLRDQADKVRWDSGPLAAGTTRLEQDVPDLPTDTRYRVVVTTRDGEEIEQWHPQGE